MENDAYRPIAAIAAMNSQAKRVWTVGLAIAAFWALLIIVDPLAKAYGLTSISSALYAFHSFICHQMPERSFHIMGEQFGVCSRCSGVYFGIFFGFAIYPLWRKLENIEPISRIWLFLSLVPIGIDWSLTFFGYWENTHLSRFLTGMLLGGVCATYIVPASVEITRNLTWKRLISKGTSREEQA
ncbi:MAG TPA: DUF2085 domain-containing protein [Pyrinomonadaceae bacterium]|nr:DUF2085 domain-containing protein [Pyrinomonadaceae bacterium]